MPISCQSLLLVWTRAWRLRGCQRLRAHDRRGYRKCVFLHRAPPITDEMSLIIGASAHHDADENSRHIRVRATPDERSADMTAMSDIHARLVTEQPAIIASHSSSEMRDIYCSRAMVLRPRCVIDPLPPSGPTRASGGQSRFWIERRLQPAPDLVPVCELVALGRSSRRFLRGRAARAVGLIKPASSAQEHTSCAERGRHGSVGRFPGRRRADPRSGANRRAATPAGGDRVAPERSRDFSCQFLRASAGRRPSGCRPCLSVGHRVNERVRPDAYPSTEKARKYSRLTPSRSHESPKSVLWVIRTIKRPCRR